MDVWFCVVCFDINNAKWRCACGGESYCSKACQTQHWAEHKEYCLVRGIRKALTAKPGISLPTHLAKYVAAFVFRTPWEDRIRATLQNTPHGP